MLRAMRSTTVENRINTFMSTELASQRAIDGYALFDNLPIAVAVVHNTTMVYANRLFASFYDMQPSELMGQPWSYLVRSSTEREYIRSIILPDFTKQGLWSGILEIVHPTRGPIPILASVERLNSSILVSLIDVSNINTNLAHRLKEREILRETLLGAKDGYWRWNVATDTMQISGDFLSRLGYTSSQYPSTFTEVCAFFHPEDLAKSLENTPRYRAGELETWRQELRIRKADGTYTWILGRGQIVDWGPEGQPALMLGTYVDINDIKEKEESSRRHNMVLETIAHVQTQFLETRLTADLNDLILGTLLDVTSASAGLFAELRRTDEGTYELQLDAYLRSDPCCENDTIDRDTWQAVSPVLLRDVATSSYISYSEGDAYHVLRSMLGCQMPACTIVLLPIWSSATLVGLAAVCSPTMQDQDQPLITTLLSTYGSMILAHRAAREQSATQSQLRQRSADLERANLELEHANRMKDVFLANMSHELRSPLATILGSTEALLEGIYGPMTKAQRRTIRGAQEGGEHLLTLINDILDLSKIRMGDLELTVEDFDVESLIQSTIGLVRELALKKGIRIGFELPAERVVTKGDVRRIKQSIVNLLTNAIKFTEEGGSVAIEVNPIRDKELVEIHIVDTGIGIPTDQLPFIFEAFYQLDSALSRKHEGTGLGLPIVQRIVDLHGGLMRVESTVGTGSRFTIVLPWVPNGGESTVESKRSQITPTEETRALATANGERVYVVDDNILNGGLVRDLLEAHGYGVDLFASAPGCIEAIEAAPPALVVMDVHMPGMDGLEAMRRIRQIDSSIPIIALTALAMPGDREQCIAAGANEYISKPLRIAEFLRNVRSLVTT